MTDSRLPGLGYLTLKDHILVRQDDLIEYVQQRIDDALAQARQEHSRRLLTAGEVADLLGVSPGTVAGLVKAGRLQAIQVGTKPDGRGALRFSQAEVERFLGDNVAPAQTVAVYQSGRAPKHQSVEEVGRLIESKRNGNGKASG